MVDKSLIRTRFGQAIESYDEEAHFQDKMASRLALFLEQEGTQPQKVLELGCGTGLFSQRLQKYLAPNGTLILNDIISEVIPALRAKVGDRPSILLGDAECIDWGKGYDLIASNASIQWWRDPLNFFDKAVSAFSKKRECRILFGTFLPDNFHELRTVTGIGLDYLSSDAIMARLERLGFGGIQLKEVRETFYFQGGILELLRHLKRTGTNALSLGSSGLWTASKLEEMESEFRSVCHLPLDAPLPLTYSALLGTATWCPKA